MTNQNTSSNAIDERPLVSILAPAFNEAEILDANLAAVCTYMDSLADRYRWELIIVDDGSTDSTYEKAMANAAQRSNVRVLQNWMNLGLGSALRTGFSDCRGTYIVVLDIDLSYAPQHIGALLEKIESTHADIVIASPYMEGGRATGIPFFRRWLSRLGNRFLSMTARGSLPSRDISTLTGMVRAYRAPFIRSVNLKSMGMEINTEIIYKAAILGARIEEIPAHLDWSVQTDVRSRRTSGKRIRRRVLISLFAGYTIRPFSFFIVPAGILALVSLYPTYWIFYHVIHHLQEVTIAEPPIDFVFSEAVARAFRTSPHAFIVAGITMMLSVQLFSLGILALQVKHNFEELFHFSTRILDRSRALEQRLERDADRCSADENRAGG